MIVTSGGDGARAAPLGVDHTVGDELDVQRSHRLVRSWVADEDDLGGTWVDLEGVVEEGLRVIREVEALDEEDEMELEGPVAQGRIWGYVTSDNSLAPFEGRWLELECKFDSMRLSRCRQDD